MTEPTLPQAIVAVFSIFFWLIATGLLTLWLLWDGIDSARKNNRLILGRGLPAKAHHARTSLFAQLGLAGMAAVVASLLVNLGSAYYTGTGKIVWTDDQIPFLCISGAIILVEFSAFWIATWLTKIADEDFLKNPWTLSATIEQELLAEHKAPTQLNMFEKSYGEIVELATRPGLYTPQGLQKLGLWSARAENEWPANPSHDSSAWAKIIRADLTWRQVIGWLGRRHWRMLSFFGSSSVLPGLAMLLVPLPVSWTRPAVGVALAALAIFALLAWPAMIVARSELVLANRRAAQHQTMVKICRERLDELRSWHQPKPADPSLEQRFTLVIRSWQISLHKQKSASA